MNILDNAGREVIRLKRPLRCSTCWCPCCLQVVTAAIEKIGCYSDDWLLWQPLVIATVTSGTCVDSPAFYHVHFTAL
jgi:hypothetical protein